MTTDVATSSLSVLDNPEMSYTVTLVNNLLESVQTHDYPNNWLHETLDKKFHGTVLLDPLFVSHDEKYRMWEEGTRASKGVGKASMFGLPPSTSPKLLRDLTKAGPSVKQVVRGRTLVAASTDADGESFFSDPGEVVTEPLGFDSDHTRMSSFIRIEPSPCWFTGFHDVTPVGDDGLWLESFTVPVFPYTSGWATGTEYLDQSDRMMRDPSEVGNIAQFDVDTLPKHSKVFMNKEKTAVPPVAYVKFEMRGREAEAEGVGPGDVAAGEDAAAVGALDVREQGAEEGRGGSFWSNGWTIAGLCVIGVGAISIAAIKMSKKAKYTPVPEGEKQSLVV